MRKGHKINHTSKSTRGKAPCGANALVDWYRNAHRKLPWRAAPGQPQIPYHVWLSEIMLQQTTVVTVVPYYKKFLKLWPMVNKLAAASESDVLREWAGLGYYSRARNLHRAAQQVMVDFGGQFPDTLDELKSLPGVGPYTAAAIAAMAFGARTVPVDGNVERVMARLYKIDTPLPQAKTEIKNRAEAMLMAAPDVYPGDFAQALMDLGATVCTPQKPDCGQCPLGEVCQATAIGRAIDYPVMPPKKDKPTRHGVVTVWTNKEGAWCVVRRPRNGLLAGMMGLPTTTWTEKAPRIKSDVVSVGTVRHSFTHFNLVLRVVSQQAQRRDTIPVDGTWVSFDTIDNIGLPRVFTKVVDLWKRQTKV